MATNTVVVEDTRTDEEKEFARDLLRCVKDDLAVAVTNMADKHSQWDGYFSQYHCDLDHDSPEWKSKVFDPESFTAVETIYPRIVNTMLGTNEVFGVKSTSQDDVVKAEATEKLLNYQSDRMGLYEKLGDICKDALIYGSGMGKVFWKREFEPRDEPRPALDMSGFPVVDQQGQPKMIKKKVWVKTYDDPWVERVSPYNLYIDPSATSLENARYVVEESKRTINYLKKKQSEGVYANVELIPKGDTNAQGMGDSEERKRFLLREQDGNRNVELYNDDMQEVTLHEYWGKFDLDGDGYLEECLIVVANGAIVIRAIQNPFPGGFKPYFMYSPIPLPGALYGMSPLHPIASLQDALNDRTNQIGDNINLSLNKMYLVNKHAGIDRDQLVSMPGGAIEVNMPTDVVPLETPDIIRSVWPEVARFEGKIKGALGVHDAVAGARPSGNEPATTTISLQQMAEIRFKTMTILFERQVIRPLGNMLIKMNKKFMLVPRQIRIVGQEHMLGASQNNYENVDPSDIVVDPDIHAVGAAIDPSVSSKMQLDGIMQFMGVVTSNPALMMNPMFGIDWSVIIEELPRLLNIKLRRPLVLPTNPILERADEEMKKQMAQQMLMAQMSSMFGGDEKKEGGGEPAKKKK